MQIVTLLRNAGAIATLTALLSPASIAADTSDSAIQQSSRDSGLPSGEVRALADSGDPSAALQKAEAILQGGHSDPELLLAAGYAARLAGHRVDALRYTDEALARRPASGDALRQRILLAEELGAAHEALGLAQLHRDLISPDQMLRLQGSDVAQLVRFGPLDAASAATRFAVTDRAITDLDEQLARLTGADSATAAARQRARVDRLVAWRQRIRMHEVVQDYEALCREQAVVPGYALAPVGDAYMYLHQPELAQPLYQRSLEIDPDNFETSVKLFYALIDMGRLDAATRFIDHLNLQQPKWVWLKGYKTPIQNPKREVTERLVAEARLDDNALYPAQQLFTSLAQAAPSNAGYRAGLGDIYAARGWPRRARGEYEIARTLDSAARDPGITASMALNDFTLQRYHEASDSISDLHRQFPELSEVRRGYRELSLYERPEYSLSLLQTSAPATSVNQGNGFLSEISAFSSPIDYRWRVHAGASYGHERYSEGDLTLRRAMLGIEYRIPNFVLQFDSTGSSYGVERAGAELQATWNPNDTWQIDGKGARLSPSTPLRALLHGITADSEEVNWTYRGSELSRATLGVGLMEFSDGNRASGLKAEILQRVYTNPSLTADALIDLAGTRNSMSKQAYYSPAQDRQALLGVTVGQVFARRYERYIKNSVTLEAGSYYERGYGSHWINRIADKLAYHINDALAVDLGLTFGRAAYDGLSQNEFSAALSVNWRI
ncbi:MAG: poly-beta-1,6 N-acetyl-D-glucosamine export porin PgaA [Steroidobacteraceae bacterium]